ncbi:MAG: HupE/UreJ family protein [Bacteroidetes bacterium]|nr:HupE/UreJ family protein [Bacteroidota bacterium]
MSIFELYLKLGFEHIADLAGYDHILFIITLCAIYKLNQWRKVIILVTAFTIGHSVTLALATLKIINITTGLIEFLIPVTIFLTALGNILQNKEEVSKQLHYFKYATAMFFGLIHGLGFSNYLKSLLGLENSILGPLFSFNIGIEIGQLIIVMIIFAISYSLTDILKVKKRELNLVISGAGLGISLILLIERWPS